MKSAISTNILPGLIVAVILFHVAVFVKAIPYNIIWGGRLQNDGEMYVFEASSIVINLFLGTILLMKAGYIKPKFKLKTINIILRVFLVLFVLNTVGNLFAKTGFEQSFALLTFIFATLIWRILKIQKQPWLH